jgi:hypothetical protein
MGGSDWPTYTLARGRWVAAIFERELDLEIVFELVNVLTNCSGIILHRLLVNLVFVEAELVFQVLET